MNMNRALYSPLDTLYKPIFSSLTSALESQVPPIITLILLTTNFKNYFVTASYDAYNQ